MENFPDYYRAVKYSKKSRTPSFEKNKKKHQKISYKIFKVLYPSIISTSLLVQKEYQQKTPQNIKLVVLLSTVFRKSFTMNYFYELFGKK